ncbi:MAG TPA: biotin/lipoyl-binding protein, partial [Ignavibacteriales bacterium]|nr:biotin/lipoyl-binding protein [Ignavibacteriales bacterium]
MKNGKKGIIAGAAVLALALLILAPKIFSSKSKQPEAAAPGRGLNASITARVVVINPRTIENMVNSSGTILGNEEVDLRSETSGKIIQILFTEGSRVNKGALLVKINDAELQAQLKKAVYNRDLAKDKE